MLYHLSCHGEEYDDRWEYYLGCYSTEEERDKAIERFMQRCRPFIEDRALIREYYNSKNKVHKNIWLYSSFADWYNHEKYYDGFSFNYLKLFGLWETELNEDFYLKENNG
jgi:hypothetical protein